MKKVILFAIAALMVSACAPDAKEDPTKWHGNDYTTSMEVDGKLVPQRNLLVCRALSEDQKTHHYYIFSADESNAGVPTENGIIYKDTSYSISQVFIHDKGYSSSSVADAGGVGELEIQVTDSGTTNYRFVANKLGDDLKVKPTELLNITSKDGVYTNRTKGTVRGLNYGATLECR